MCWQQDTTAIAEKFRLSSGEDWTMDLSHDNIQASYSQTVNQLTSQLSHRSFNMDHVRYIGSF